MDALHIQIEMNKIKNAAPKNKIVQNMAKNERSRKFVGNKNSTIPRLN